MTEEVYLLFFSLHCRGMRIQETLRGGTKCFGCFPFCCVCIFPKLFTYLCCFEIMTNWTKPLDKRKLW